MMDLRQIPHRLHFRALFLPGEACNEYQHPMVLRRLQSDRNLSPPEASPNPVRLCSGQCMLMTQQCRPCTTSQDQTEYPSTVVQISLFGIPQCLMGPRLSMKDISSILDIHTLLVTCIHRTRMSISLNLNLQLILLSVETTEDMICSQFTS